MIQKAASKIYSSDLGIDLKSKKETEFFKWFLACLLFGKPIQQQVAKRTYFEFIKTGLASPQAILQVGWDKLVKILDQGHYVRYDFSTATKLSDICKALINQYGTITNLIKESNSLKGLQRRLLQFKGIGPVTAKIFLRDLKLHKVI